MQQFIHMWATCRQGIMCGPYLANKFGVNYLKILPHIGHFQISPHIGHMWQSKSKVQNCFCHIWVTYIWRCLAYMWLKILPLICHMWPKCRILNGLHMANMWHFVTITWYTQDIWMQFTAAKAKIGIFGCFRCFIQNIGLRNTFSDGFTIFLR